MKTSKTAKVRAGSVGYILVNKGHLLLLYLSISVHDWFLNTDMMNYFHVSHIS